MWARSISGHRHGLPHFFALGDSYPTVLSSLSSYHLVFGLFLFLRHHLNRFLSQYTYQIMYIFILLTFFLSFKFFLYLLALVCFFYFAGAPLICYKINWRWFRLNMTERNETFIIVYLKKKKKIPIYNDFFLCVCVECYFYFLAHFISFNFMLFDSYTRIVWSIFMTVWNKISFCFLFYSANI